jgi:hypothetical protein
MAANRAPKACAVRKATSSATDLRRRVDQARSHALLVIRDAAGRGDRRAEEAQAHADGEADPADRICAKRAIRVAHLGHRLEREAADEYAEPTEQRLLGRRQQFVAPVQGSTQRPLPLWLILRPAIEDDEPTIQAAEQRPRWQYAHAGGSQLDRQRQPVQAHADFGYCAYVALIHAELRIEALRAL